MRARWALVAALLVGACNGGGEGRGRDTTLPPRVSTTASTVVDYSVPEVIDAAYVEKVMAALDHVYGDAIRILAHERKITQDFLERLGAIYGDRFFRIAQRSWGEEIHQGLATLAAVPGDPRTTVGQILSASQECIVAAVRRDFSPIRAGEPASTPQRYIALVPRNTSVKTVNPTPLILSYDGWTSSGDPPVAPCENA